MKAKNSIDQHREKIALKTLKMPDPIAKVMSMGRGQPFTDKEDAKEFLKSIGYSDKEIKRLSESKIKLQDLIESIDIAQKYAKGNEELIASNESYWQWEYDQDTNHALLFMKANGDLRLSISNEHIKSGLGKGEFYKELESEDVGSVRKPDIARIKSLTKKHGHDRTRAGGPFKAQWFDVLNSKSDTLQNIIKQYAMTNEEFKKGQTVKYIVPGTTNKMKTGKITGFESTRTEDFAIIDGKTIPFKNLSEANKSFKNFRILGD
ncbi:MAG: hypothetical protein JETCAE03_34000 [Ignavibacteriaceae bacterium]|jgi:hypothetical protein|nr:MAG: hypothetical protein JETCAE03_34000 [Ignavibacteriaceae bacterium]